jgi:hypothetical protein
MRRYWIVVCVVFVVVLSACAPQGSAPSSEEQAETVAAQDPVNINACLSFHQVALVETLSDPIPDYTVLSDFMVDSFEVAIWPMSTEQLSPEEAVVALESTLLPPGSGVTFSEDEDIAALLGVDPFESYPDAVGFMFSRGWGAEGADEAVLIFSWDTEGNHYWRGILLARGGFSPLASDEADPSG